MTHSQHAAVPALVLRRTYSVPPESVYAAWTEPDTIVRFFTTPQTKATRATLDVKTGGSFRIEMTTSEGEAFNAKGTYLTVRAPECLVMTWRWEEDDPADEHESLLTLEFKETNGKTDFVLTHENLASVESVHRHEGGWSSMLEQLAIVLGS